MPAPKRWKKKHNEIQLTKNKIDQQEWNKKNDATPCWCNKKNELLQKKFRRLHCRLVLTYPGSRNSPMHWVNYVTLSSLNRDLQQKCSVRRGYRGVPNEGV